MSLTDYSFIEKYIPEESLGFILGFIDKYEIYLKVSKERTTKLGDYKFSTKSGHSISINNNLNKYEFLIVLLHEFAHALVYSKYRRRKKPHGKEWKSIFKELLSKNIELNAFPEKLEYYVLEFISKDLSPSSKDNLYVALKEYSESIVYLKDIPFDTTFTVKGGRELIKIEKLRKRYKCKDIKNKRMYLVHPLTIVLDYN